MKVVVLGAGGKLGRRLAASALARGFEVTAAVRDPQRLRREAPDIAARMSITRFDASEHASIDAAIAGHDAMVSAAGHIADGARFVELFDRVVSSAERVLGAERRVWMLAGAAVLDIPHAGRMGIEVPFAPKIYLPHLENRRRIERSRLDWALMCPGGMSAGDEQPINDRLRVSVDTYPFDVGGWTRFAPPIALSLMMKSKLPLLGVTYRGVADVIMDNFAPGRRFRQKRVGVGWKSLDDKAKLGAAQ